MCTPVKELQYTAYSAMSGIIYPLQYSSYIDNVAIVPYAAADATHAKEIESEIIAYWEHDIPSEQRSEGYIMRNWAMPDTFYVMTDFWNQFLYGCIAVDTHNGIPFISHVYIRPEHRGRGLSKYLMMIAEQYVEKLGYTNVKLWCKNEMKAFYSKQGYCFERKLEKDYVIMCKNVGDKHTDTSPHHL